MHVPRNYSAARHHFLLAAEKQLPAAVNGLGGWPRAAPRPAPTCLAVQPHARCLRQPAAGPPRPCLLPPCWCTLMSCFSGGCNARFGGADSCVPRLPKPLLSKQQAGGAPAALR